MTATRFYVGSVFVLGSINDVTALALSQPLGLCGKGEVEPELGADILKPRFRLVTQDIGKERQA